MYPTQMPQMIPPYAFPPNMYPPMNNNNNKDSTDELLKIFILKKEGVYNLNFILYKFIKYNKILL